MNRLSIAAAGALVALTLILEIAFRHHAHAHYWWHSTPLFDLPFGLVGCVVIILISKGVGHTWLERNETYYGDEQP